MKVTLTKRKIEALIRDSMPAGFQGRDLNFQYNINRGRDQDGLAADASPDELESITVTTKPARK